MYVTLGDGQAEAERQRPRKYHFQPTLPGGDVRVCKCLCFLLHQCTEGDIQETKLFRAVSAIRWKLAHEIISRTAEFQRAEWE